MLHIIRSQSKECSLSLHGFDGTNYRKCPVYNHLDTGSHVEILETESRNLDLIFLLVCLWTSLFEALLQGPGGVGKELPFDIDLQTSE